MGNFISCTISCTLLSSTTGYNSKAAKVIFPSGEIRELDEPIKAAELMFESPNFFLVNSRSLQIGRRFSALNADEDLEMGNVYIMFPMKRVNSVITAADMGALLITAKRAYGGKVRILPEAGEDARASATINDYGESEVVLPRLNLDDLEEFSLPDFKHRLSMCRSRKPALETIIEESVCSR
ncbi:hypothetical protein HHK36_024578 [Tetracentron sinense]|uniref:Uncharacterized protein n=1 Tax=Tetracentron sinense TaxID=13715 RepID=A0A834YKJ3_TETSI|nr:hypothetical protein HHK36_024578 [Tetracentron sinense]